MKTDLTKMANAMFEFIEISRACGYAVSIEINKIEDQHEQETETEYIVEEREEGKSRDEIEKELIKDALIKNNRSLSDTARYLQLSERTLLRKIKQYNIKQEHD